MLDVFDPDNNRAVVADWLELELAFGRRLSVTDALVVRSDQVLEDDPRTDDEDAGEETDEETHEPLDALILDSKAEARRDDLWNELHHRQRALGDRYPFSLAANGGVNWELSRRVVDDPALQAAHTVYLAALVMSAFKNLHIKKRPQNADWARLYKEIPDFMQQLATVAAASLMGEAYSFGWPRDDSSGFRQAIVDVLSRVGLGRCVTEFPADSTGKENDGTVDVIAWRSFADGLYGGLIMYGQVASGMNWHDKSVKMFLTEKLLRYFAKRPSEHYIPALFIPFMLHNDLAPKKGVSMADAMADYSEGREQTFGTVVDRLRLTELVGAGLPDSERVHNCVAPDALIELVHAWVTEVRDYCNAAA